MTITRELQSISKKLAKLVNQTEKIAEELGKVQKKEVKPAKPKTKTKAKTAAKKASAKAVKKAPAKAAKKAPAKAAKKTDTDKVLGIINRSKKGVDTATLMKKTGFDQKKVRNILHRTFKQGKITRAEKGIYVGVK
jgi:hypothetical protein